MTEATPAVQDPGLLARFIGIITSPKATFATVVALPKPFGILLVVAAIMAVFTGGAQFTETGRQAVLDMNVQMMERFGQQVTDEMYTAMERQATFGAYWTVISQFIFLPIMALFFAGLFWGVFNALLGGSATFKKVLAVVTHSMVIMAIGAAIAVPIQLAQGQMTITGPFNLSVLVPMLDENSFITRFLSGINLFTLWHTVVVAIGLGVLYRRKTAPIAITLLVVYGVVVVIGVSIFSMFMGRG
jgi:predicted RND superfamily exporter protein